MWCSFALNVSQPAVVPPAWAPADDGAKWNSVTTSVILPLAAGSIWIASPPAAGQQQQQQQQQQQIRTLTYEEFQIPSGAFNKSISLGSTIALCVGKGAVAMRIFAADGSPSTPGPAKPALLMLAGDDRGMPLGAVRLVAYHYQGQYKPAHVNAEGAYGVPDEDTHLRFGALIKAAAVPAPRDATTVIKALLNSLTSADVTAKETEADGSKMWVVSARVDPAEPFPLQHPAIPVDTGTAGSTDNSVLPNDRGSASADGRVELSVTRNLTSVNHKLERRAV